MNKEELDKWWEWQCWRRRMNATTTKFSPEFVKEYLKGNTGYKINNNKRFKTP